MYLFCSLFALGPFLHSPSLFPFLPPLLLEFLSFILSPLAPVLSLFFLFENTAGNAYLKQIFRANISYSNEKSVDCKRIKFEIERNNT